MDTQRLLARIDGVTWRGHFLFVKQCMNATQSKKVSSFVGYNESMNGILPFTHRVESEA